MASQGTAFDFNAMDFSTAGLQLPRFAKSSEDNTSQAFWDDEGIDTTTGGSFGQQSYDSLDPSIFAPSPEHGYGMQQTLNMDNTMGSTSAWPSQLVPSPDTTLSAFPHTSAESFDSLYQPQFSTALGKRPLELDVSDFPHPKRQENYNFPPYTPSASATGSSWALDTQPTPAPSSTSCEVGLSDEAADVCAMWFSKYAVLPSDRHIDSLSQLTGESAAAIRHWFGQLLRQGMAGHDSAYKSQTSLCPLEQTWGESSHQPTTEPITEQTPCSHDTSNTQPVMRGGRKGCVPTESPELLCRDPNKIYQCTRKCGKRYGRKCDWKRNEEEGYPSKSWICGLCKSQGIEKVKPCFRKYHFSQHFRNIHPGLNCTEYEEESIVHTDSAFPKKCGFCPHQFTSRQERIDHIADHFKKGKCMLDWNEDDDDNNDSDNMDDDDDDRPDGGDADSNHFFQPPNKQNGPGSRHNGSDDGGDGSGSQHQPSGFHQFQLQQLSGDGNNTSRACGGSNQHIFTASERADTVLRGQSLKKLHTSNQCAIHGQSSVSSHQYVHGKQHVPKESNSDALARDALAKSLSEQRDISRESPDVVDHQLMVTLSTGCRENDRHAPSNTAMKESTPLDDRVSSLAPDAPPDLVSSPSPILGDSRSLSSGLVSHTPSPVVEDARGSSPASESHMKSPMPLFSDNCTSNFRSSSQDANFEVVKQKLLTVCKDNQLIVQLADTCAELVASNKNDHLWNRWSRQNQGPEHDNAVVQPSLDFALNTNERVVKSVFTRPSQSVAKLCASKGQVLSPFYHPLAHPIGTMQKLIMEKDHNAHVTVGTSQSFLSVKLLGTGGFSTVDEVVHRETNLRISRKTLKNREQSAIDELKKEVNVLQKLRHPHIIRFLGAYSKGDKMSILLSPVAEMTLAVWLDSATHQRPAGLAETIFKMLGCLSSTVRYLHEQRPVVKHMDIKPQNILIVQGNHEYPHVVLSDFGISSSEEVSPGEGSGPLTRHYCAPEVFGKMSREQEADIWSLGCVFAEMASTAFTQDNPRWLEFRKEFRSREGKYYWQDVHGLQERLTELFQEATTTTEHSVIKTVKSMLNSDPAERPDATLLTMTFKPAPCCISWPNEQASFPGPHAELSSVEMLVHDDNVDCLAQVQLCSGIKEEKDEQSFSQGSAWLDECLHDHEACVWPTTGAGDLPTRLIDVRPEGANGKYVRIVESSGIDSGPGPIHYATICYEGQSDVRLTTSLLQSMQDEVLREALPSTLDEAISTVNDIGLRYVWVDSMCIIQDSEDDRQRECAAMASVYRNAHVTILLDQEQLHGPELARVRTDTYNRHYMEPVATADQQRSTPVSFQSIDFTAPAFAWDTRAWSLQERLLSRRYLRLGSKQMYWECSSLKASETFPQGLPSLLWEKVHTKPSIPAAHQSTLDAAVVKVDSQCSEKPCPSCLEDNQWIKKEGDGIGDDIEVSRMTLELTSRKTITLDPGQDNMQSKDGSAHAIKQEARERPYPRFTAAVNHFTRPAAGDAHTSMCLCPNDMGYLNGHGKGMTTLLSDPTPTNVDTVMRDAEPVLCSAPLMKHGSYLDYGGRRTVNGKGNCVGQVKE